MNDTISIHNFYRRTLFSIITILGLALPGCDSTSKNNTKNTTDQHYRAVWTYQIESWSRPDEKLAEIGNNGYNVIFASIDTTRLTGASHADEVYSRHLTSCISAASGSGIEIHAMIMEQPSYTLAANHPKALLELERLLQFNELYPDTQFAGIHLDVEPHALDMWKDAADDYSDGVREDLLKQFLSLLEKSSNVCSGEKITLSAAMTWWYDSKYRDGLLPSADTGLYSEYLDLLVVMAYSNSVEPVSQAADECKIMPVVVGITVDNYQSIDQLNSEIGKIESDLSFENNYKGYAVFTYEKMY